MQYAVIESGGKQYTINTGDTISIQNLNKEVGEAVSFDKVLLVVNDGKVSLGTPYVANAVVDAKVVGNKKGEKIFVAKFKAKSKYRRYNGHRQAHTQVEIAKISTAVKA